MNTTKSTSSNYLYQLTIIGVLFATFGFVTWLNSILIPFLKNACELTDQQAFYVATAFFAAYFFIPLPSSWILEKLGTKKGMSLGLVIMSLGAIVFVPAASARSYEMFLAGLFIMGMGLALLQTASNPYVSILGPIESAAKRISIMGICNKLAGMIANFLLGSILLKNADVVEKQIKEATDPIIKSQLLNDLASRVVTPYIVMAAVLLIVAFIIQRSSLPDIKEQAGEGDTGDTALSKDKTSIFQFTHVWLGAFAIFFYVGAEVMAGDLITVYGKNLGFSGDDAKYFTNFGLAGLLIGYGVSIVLIPKYIKQETWLFVSAILGIILTFASYFVGDKAAVVCLATLGFANAVMWPAIFPLGIKDLGRFTNVGSAIMVMGIVGGALIPPFYGWLYEKAGLGLDFRSAFLVIMSISYVYILWFGLKGHKMGTNTK
jgi:MFS transporter, FHS family, L-fucose permease